MNLLLMILQEPMPTEWNLTLADVLVIGGLVSFVVTAGGLFWRIGSWISRVGDNLEEAVKTNRELIRGQQDIMQTQRELRATHLEVMEKVGEQHKEQVQSLVSAIKVLAGKETPREG